MKVIFSRKGFDSSCGGMPSPILEDGTIISFPIPTGKGNQDYNIRYRDLKPLGHDLGKMLDDLAKPSIQPSGKANKKKCKLNSNNLVHLDPDIYYDALPNRDPEWRGLFGQCYAAQGHLRKQEIGSGDLFLFYGLYQKVKFVDGTYVYDKSHEPIHLIWGWLQVDDIVPITEEIEKQSFKYPWATYHQHYNYNKSPANNTMYVAQQNLILDGKTQKGIKGYGVFSKYDPRLQLTDPDYNKTSYWRLPKWMYKKGENCPITYNGNREWRLEDGYARLKTFTRAQEYVLNLDGYPEVTDWIKSIIT